MAVNLIDWTMLDVDMPSSPQQDIQDVSPVGQDWMANIDEASWAINRTFFITVSHRNFIPQN